jgi:hypothetical protein
MVGRHALPLGLMLTGCLHFADEVKETTGPGAGEDVLPVFTAVQIVGTCVDPAQPDLMSLWTVPLAGETMLQPADVVQSAEGPTTVAQAFSASTITFEALDDAFSNEVRNAVADAPGTGEVDLNLSARAVRWVAAGADVPMDKRLITVLWEHSASLDDFNGGNARGAFLDQLLRRLPGATFALVAYDGDGARLVVSGVDARSDVRQAMEDELAGETGEGSLAAALTFAREEVIRFDRNATHSVLVLTDGVGDDEDLSSEIAQYKTAGVPVVVVHLKENRELPHSAALQALGCETGGSTYTIPSPTALTNALDQNSPIGMGVSARLTGGWRVDVDYQPERLSSAPWLIRSNLSLAMDRTTRFKNLALVEKQEDARLFVVVPEE